MPNQKKNYGVRKERDIIKYAKQSDAITIRAGGSLGLFDIASITKSGKILFIQSKSSKVKDTSQMLNLCEKEFEEIIEKLPDSICFNEIQFLVTGFSKNKSIIIRRKLKIQVIEEIDEIV